LYFRAMKRSFWYGLSSLLLAGPLHAQTLAGAWQGVETDVGDPRYYPAVLRLQGKDANLFGVLYQEVGSQPGVTVTFQLEGARNSAKLQLKHVRKLNETGGSFSSYWCAGAIAFTYDAALEKLTGHATYRPIGDCDHGTFTFYRVKLKSAATVKAGAASALRVSGRDVRWFADAELKKPLAEGNIYQTKLSKTTTFYLTQGFYPSAEKVVTPITVTVTGKAPATQPRLTPPPAAPVPVDTAAVAPPVAAAPPAAPAPVVLPTVLFKQGTAELLPEASPALDRLAADLLAAPALRLRIAGHTDRLGEPGKNQVLSEQRAEAVRAYLVKASVPTARLETVGYGDTRPLHPSPDVRNRRVEVEKLP
jgi:OOP family OmpA-OmpF porin